MVKQGFPKTGGEADRDRQSTQSAMLDLPPNITCNLTAEEEKALARQIAEQGDESATVRLYCCCLRDVFYYFFRRTRGNRSETEYLTQETLLRAIQQLRDGAWKGETFRPWLFGIAQNVIREWWRGNKRWSPTPGRNGSHPADEKEQLEQQIDLLEEVLIRERGITLWGVVRELPVQDQLVLFLRHIQDLHYAEMAAVLNCTEHACRTRHYRALDRLREKIRQMGLGEELGFSKGKRRP